MDALLSLNPLFISSLSNLRQEPATATRRGDGVSAGEGGVSGGNGEAAGSVVAMARCGVSGNSGEAAGSAAATARRGVGGDNDEARGRQRRCSRAAASTPSVAPLPSLPDPAKGEERKERWRRLPLEVAASSGGSGAPPPTPGGGGAPTQVGMKEKIGVKPGEMFLDLESEAGRGP
uniref:Uncharacterized protein n=1 Tax=Oryza barthii TaxID=65489 RepID=A0A0D3FJ70_9ORYZ